MQESPVYTQPLDMPVSSPMPKSVDQKREPRRKRKQVKNACINCQKACKKCDEGRACQRCVKLGIADTCVDSPRKERLKGVKRGPYKKRQKKVDQTPRKAKNAKPVTTIMMPSTIGQPTVSSQEMMWRPTLLTSAPVDLQSPVTPPPISALPTSTFFQEDCFYSPSLVSSISSETSPVSMTMTLPLDTHQHVFSVEEVLPVNLTEPASSLTFDTTPGYTSLSPSCSSVATATSWWLPNDPTCALEPVPCHDDLSQPIYQQPCSATLSAYSQKETPVFYWDSSSLDWLSNTPTTFI
ncbi:hypothetical protein DM01DRAFT_1335050 [Hesseltinella vesiculosa]|uniref:Zn(2)-C6 fungal-type domain-containing protein n=1 Tax=Hesseltinella vesiculosa TaxID=101127 RepID=A0A1X2GK39_9FUNG|nr:hypothetical protein DM01DRAFT_1335050 [Hesseltinella vesiculosa]